jgi:D-Tyr-tRNAtyr deacylase
MDVLVNITIEDDEDIEDLIVKLNAYQVFGAYNGEITNQIQDFNVDAYDVERCS